MSNGPLKRFRIRNCCLGYYRVLIDGSYFCMLTNTIECDKRHSVKIDGLALCKSQSDCIYGDSFSGWIASGIPKEEWVEIEEITPSLTIVD